MAQQIILNVENISIVASLRKVLSAMDGVTIMKPARKSTRKLTSYEQAREDIRKGNVTTYESLDDFYKNMGI